MMRAKLKLESVTAFEGGEKLKFHAAAKTGPYPEDGSNEDNTFAKFSPTASMEITVMNPALLGKFKAGEKFYVDFTKAAL